MRIWMRHWGILHHPLEETRTVYILRFLYGGRDYENMI